MASRLGNWVPGDLVDVGGDLGVVGGDHPERLGGQLLAQLAGQDAELAQLAGHPAVVGRIGDRGDGRVVPGGGSEQGHPADVDHLDHVGQGDLAGADLGRERLDVDDHDVDRADAVGGQLLELGWIVAAGEDPGVDSWMERLDLAADERRDVGQVGDRADLDAVLGQVVAGAVGREDLDAEGEQLPREGADAIAAGHRDQGSHPGYLPPA